MTTRLMDGFTIEKLLELLKAGKINGKALTTHSLHFSDMVKAYDMFAAAAQSHALKIIISFEDTMARL